MIPTPPANRTTTSAAAWRRVADICNCASASDHNAHTRGSRGGSGGTGGERGAMSEARVEGEGSLITVSSPRDVRGPAAPEACGDACALASISSRSVQRLLPVALMCSVHVCVAASSTSRVHASHGALSIAAAPLATPPVLAIATAAP